jgi:hypothetical protein
VVDAADPSAVSDILRMNDCGPSDHIRDPAVGADRSRAAAQPDPAQAAYEERKRLYDLIEWGAAIAKFKEAYRVSTGAGYLGIGVDVSGSRMTSLPEI